MIGDFDVIFGALHRSLYFYLENEVIHKYGINKLMTKNIIIFSRYRIDFM